MFKDVKGELIDTTRPRDKENSQSRTHGGQGYLTEFIYDRRPPFCNDQHCRIHRK